MAKRIKVKNYTGVYYRLASRIGGKGQERVYYVVYKKDGKVIEAKAGRQHTDDMTPAKASGYRHNLIEGRAQTPQEAREAEEAAKKAKDDRWTINKLWAEYRKNKPHLKGIVTDKNRFENYIKSVFGEKEPHELAPLDVDRVRLKLLKKKAPGTVKNVLELLRRIINFGIKKNLSAGCGFTIEMPTVNNVKTEDLNPEQLKSLLKAIDKADHIQAANMMKLVLFTGLRRGEMFKLKWVDVNFDREFILLVDPKGGPDQKIPLNETARQLLKFHPKTDSQFVFPGRGGGQRVDIKHQVNAIKEAAGLPKGFRALHGLRHVYASMLASSGKVDLYTLQKLLTHKSPQMTQRYAHLRNEALKQASNLTADLVNQAISDSQDKKTIGIQGKR